MKKHTLNKAKEDTVKAIGLSFIASFLLDKAGKVLKEDSYFYKQSTKRLVNQLVESNIPVLNVARKVTDGTHSALKDLDEEDIENTKLELDEEINLLNLFCEIYFRSSVTRVVDMQIMLTNIAHGKHLFTEDEVFSILRKFASETTVVQYNDETLKQYLNK